MEKHGCGTERLSSGIAMQKLSADQLGRRMAMKRHSLVLHGRGIVRLRMAAAVQRLIMQRHCIALLGKGLEENSDGNAKICEGKAGL